MGLWVVVSLTAADVVAARRATIGPQEIPTGVERQEVVRGIGWGWHVGCDDHDRGAACRVLAAAAAVDERTVDERAVRERAVDERAVGELADAYANLADAYAELADAYAELADAYAELADAYAELADAHAELVFAHAKLVFAHPKLVFASDVERIEQFERTRAGGDNRYIRLIPTDAERVPAFAASDRHGSDRDRPAALAGSPPWSERQLARQLRPRSGRPVTAEPARATSAVYRKRGPDRGQSYVLLCAARPGAPRRAELLHR
jgi:hypothetical protein